jgi:Cell division protein CrgA
MPKSRVRKKDDKAAPTANVAKLGPSANWVAPLMVGLFMVGLLWIVIYYVSNGDWPMPGIGNANLLVGFAFITGGFVTATQWR